jgi:uncharacterized protein (DUF1778 family)
MNLRDIPMATAAKGDARLDFRLPSEVKEEIEMAAAQLGQTVSAFAVGTLAEAARRVMNQAHITKLSNRDRDIFIAMLEDVDAEPNEALVRAAERYKKHFARTP